MSADDELKDWLIGPGRLSGDGVAIAEGYVRRLAAAGVPLSRARFAQRLANPLLSAWGIIWTPEETTEYTVAREILETGAWLGSPFQQVVTDRSMLHKSLIGLDPDRDHITYHELAAAGGTDFFAMALEYGDGSAQGCSFVTADSGGFAPAHIDLIADTRHALAAAFEPVAMRRSSESLLRTYLGEGPAKAVIEGTIRRGEHLGLDAVVMFSDLRDFTAKSESWSDTALLSALDGYFEAVVRSVHAHGGDVLKFIGDGVLAIFPVDGGDPHSNRCRDALKAAADATDALRALNVRRRGDGLEPLAAGIGIHLGAVIFGNIGSPDRLDFTVIAPTVNVASRVQELCKPLGESVLVTSAVAERSGETLRSLGVHPVKGLAAPIEVFGLQPADGSP
ncbi:MAG: adenylate/guanylate cyclase domain-containing protein [Rhodospirillaceae bacterium]|nr:adenylate/guanylate cyclase domain-containing protein [Rhodospirillaceae bacterium]MYF87798.1 adenylate/guanylate cyclase domain-containing protein [Rhodospirillaceae bacterium]MYH36566.1 adenylate/guanylate cyclase domain-containing protein [Rhodospirillaceae bacterium]MYK16469.1 adenylate/guanylate cyclase domain-containing protein [Rhodospirillaceae bacterium]